MYSWQTDTYSKRKYSRFFFLVSYDQQFVSSSETTKLVLPGHGFFRNIEEIACGIFWG